MWKPGTVGNLVCSVFRSREIETGAQVTIVMLGKARAGTNDDRIKLSRTIAIPIGASGSELSGAHAVFRTRRAPPPTHLLDHGERVTVVHRENDITRAEQALHAQLRKEVPFGVVSWPIDPFRTIARGACVRPRAGQHVNTAIESITLLLAENGGCIEAFCMPDPHIISFATTFPGDRTSVWQVKRNGHTIDEGTLGYPSR